MVEAANLRELNDSAKLRRLHFSEVRRILAKRKMRARSVVVANVAAQNSSQMDLVEDHGVVKAFPPDGTDDAFDIRILPWRTWCTENLLDAERLDAAPEVSAVDAVAITDQIPRCCIPWERFDELSSGPFGGGMFGDVEWT